MSDNTSIEWTDATWNTVYGCTRVSPGCQNCYAERMSARFSGEGEHFEGVAHMTEHGPRWTGMIRTIPKNLSIPLRWKKPRRIFVNSMSDTFHKDVPFEYIAAMFGVMALTKHTYQVLTKRIDRAVEFFAWLDRMAEKVVGIFPEETLNWRRWHVIRAALVRCIGSDIVPSIPDENPPWPLPNVWVGTSVENQEYADKRIPDLLKVPAAVRFLSCEPLLGPLELTNVRVSGTAESGDYVNALSLEEWTEEEAREEFGEHYLPTIDWVIAGGESGPGARPMHPDWVRSIRDQCEAAGVPFLFKQWGAYAPQIAYGMTWEDKAGQLLPMRTVSSTDRKSVGELTYHAMPPGCKTGPGKVEVVRKVGKKAAGRLLDGRIHDEFPHMREEERAE